MKSSIFTTFVFSLALGNALAFVPSSFTAKKRNVLSSMNKDQNSIQMKLVSNDEGDKNIIEKFSPFDFESSEFLSSSENKNSPLDLCKVSTAILSSLTLPLLLPAEEAVAKGGEWGLLEGRSFAFVHPLTMFVLFTMTAWSGYLGLQYRRTRELATDISTLKKSLPTLSSGDKVPSSTSAVDSLIATLQASMSPPAAANTNINAAVTDGPAVNMDQLKNDINLLQSSSTRSLVSDIESKTNKRKELMKEDFRDQHFSSGSWLLGVGVFASILGGFNTFFRAGKLFPGPHLYAGAGITVLWAAAAALVPAMQKGNNTARSLHIALNTTNLILFAWQVNTGLEILFKVLKFTKWP